jgi:hypothetical protein
MANLIPPSYQQRVPYVDDKKCLQIPAAAMSGIPVVNIAYAAAELAAGVEGLQATCATAPASAIFDIDFGFEQASLTPGLGVLLTDLVLEVAQLAQALTGPPTLALSSVSFPAAGVTGAPVAAPIGGPIVTAPAVLPVAITPGGQVVSEQFILAVPGYRMNTDQQKVVGRLVVPMAVGGQFLLAAAFVHFINTISLQQ